MAIHLIWLFFVASFLVIVAAGVTAFLLWQGRPQHLSPTPHSETPRQILDRRFAAGEIDAEEYKRSRDLLGGGGKTSPEGPAL